MWCLDRIMGLDRRYLPGCREGQGMQATSSNRDDLLILEEGMEGGPSLQVHILAHPQLPAIATAKQVNLSHLPLQ